MIGSEAGRIMGTDPEMYAVFPHRVFFVSIKIRWNCSEKLPKANKINKVLECLYSLQ